MITQHIREHDDSYVIEIPDYDEIRCICDRIVHKDSTRRCEICDGLFCRGCMTEDYRDTGLSVCSNCIEKPQNIIDALTRQLCRLHDQSQPAANTKTLKLKPVFNRR